MYDFAFYFMLFFGFSVVGWLTECISCSIWYHRFIYNRGFLLGPYCPIYGVGALGGYLFLSSYADEPIALFTMAMVGASIIEYLTSFIMEKIFKARWWDYTKEPFNIEGRVCLKNSILFGIMGLVFVYYVKPFYEHTVGLVSNNTLITLSIICSVILIIDCITTYILMSKIKNQIVEVKKDSTYDIDKAIIELFKGYTFYLKKLFKSFPGVSFNVPSSEQIVSTITKTINGYNLKKKTKKEKNLKK